MNASMRNKDTPVAVTDDETRFSQHGDEVVPITWADARSAERDQPARDEDFVDMDMQVDRIPTLYDVVERDVVAEFEYEHEFTPEPEAVAEHEYEYVDGDENEVEQSIVWEPADDLLHTQSIVAAAQVANDEPQYIEDSIEDAQQAESLTANNQTEDETLLAELQDNAAEPLPDIENPFHLASYEPVTLQRALMVLAGIFEIIAGAALWRAIGDKVVVTELVPPMVYAVIGIVAYLLGMRYLRIHFAQVRVSDKDWLLCEQVVVAADNGVMLKARFGTAYLVWEQLLGVAHDSDYYYLLIEPTQGFKVPRQGISDPALQVKLDDMASLTKAHSLYA